MHEIQQADLLTMEAGGGMVVSPLLIDLYMRIGKGVIRHPDLAQKKRQRRAIDAGVEMIERVNFTPEAIRRAAPTPYSSTPNERKGKRGKAHHTFTPAERKAIMHTNARNIIADSVPSAEQELMRIERLNGDESFMMLYLISKADPLFKTPDGHYLITTTLTELANLLQIDQKANRARQQVGNMLYRLHKAQAVIDRNGGQYSGAILLESFTEKEKGRGNRAELVINKHLVERIGRQYYGLSIKFMYLMGNIGTISAEGGQVIGIWNAYDTLSPTARRIARKLYITSKLITDTAIKGTLDEIAANYTEETAGGVTRRLTESTKTALQYLQARGQSTLQHGGRDMALFTVSNGGQS